MNDETIRYTGDGSAYVEGIPARDLTRAEWDRIRRDLQALALATGLYALPPIKTDKPARHEKPAPTEA